MNNSIAAKLTQLSVRLEELTRLLSSETITANLDNYRKLTRERAEITPVVELYHAYQQGERDIQTAQEMSADLEMREFADAEIREGKEKLLRIEAELQKQLLPKDPNDDKNLFLEIRAGTGGDESALFAADLFRMYSRYAERQRWKVEIVSRSESDLGGFREIIAGEQPGVEAEDLLLHGALDLGVDVADGLAIGGHEHCGQDQRRDPAAQDGLLAEEVRLCLLLERRLDHAGARAGALEVEQGGVHPNPALRGVREGQQRIDGGIRDRVFQIQVPAAFLVPAEADAAVGHHEPAGCRIEHHGLPLGVVRCVAHIRGAQEVTPDKKVIFQFKSPVQKGGGTYSCQRLENGATLIGENSTGKVLGQRQVTRPTVQHAPATLVSTTPNVALRSIRPNRFA